MTDDPPTVNLLKLLVAEIHASTSMLAAREMFGKSYFSLGVGERLATDQAVFGAIQGNYQGLTPALFQTLGGPTAATLRPGFQGPTGSSPTGPTTPPTSPPEKSG